MGLIPEKHVKDLKGQQTTSTPLGGTTTAATSPNSKRVQNRIGEVREGMTITMEEKFVGAMIGGLFGDCLGNPVKRPSDNPLPAHFVDMQFELYYQERRPSVLSYTDTTELSFQSANSIATKSELNMVDLACRLVNAFWQQQQPDHNREEYEAGIELVLDSLGKDHGCSGNCSQCTNVLVPAQKLNSESSGNGCATRAHVIALFTARKDIKTMLELVKTSCLLTHTHRDAVAGAMLQATAVRLAIYDTPWQEFVPHLKELFGNMSWWLDVMQDSLTFSHSKFEPLLSMSMGTSDSAAKGVPLAIYSFLAARSGAGLNVSYANEDSNVVRVLKVAYEGAGESDAVGSMAAVLAGAQFGYRIFPLVLLKQCRGVEKAQLLGRKLYELAYYSAPES